MGYSAWSITYGGPPFSKGWGLTYTETTVGQRRVGSVGLSWGKTLAFFGVIGYSKTIGKVLVDPAALPEQAEPTVSPPTVISAALSQDAVVSVLSGWSFQFFLSAGTGLPVGVGGILNISLSTPPANASPFSVEIGTMSPGAGGQIGWGWPF